MALTADIYRAYETSVDREINEAPVIASGKIFEGSAVGDGGVGNARALVAADPFLGFAREMVDNAGGAAGAKRVKLVTAGAVDLVLTGTEPTTPLGALVYASDDGTFTHTAAANTTIGKITRKISTLRYIVRFEGVGIRSV